MTRRVVARYAATDGALGQEAAEKVLPARRELWRLVEALAPRALAAALRSRLALNDQSGRGGVRELRAALADWLDPPPTCAHCGRHFDPARTTGRNRLACPARTPRKSFVNGRPLPTPCAAHRGPRSRTGHDAHPTVARCGTLALFTPVHLDPTCWAAQRLLKHGGSLAYDVVVDRDARILLSVTTPQLGGATLCPTSTRTGGIECGMVVETSWHTASHVDNASTALITAARRNLDRVLADAVAQNGRLILGTQVRYFAPKAGVTRADLVQGGALGCRRALLDYDCNFRPKGKKQGVRFSTYGINWIHQGIGEVFAERDLVSVPQWCLDLRADVEALGLSPGLLLSHVLAVVETRADAALRLASVGELLEMIGPSLPPVPEDMPPRGDHDLMVAVASAATRKPPKGKNPPNDERSAEQVATVVAGLLGLECGAGKPCTGAALLTALRSGMSPAMVPVSVGGERDDGPGGAGDGGGEHGGGQADYAEHLRASDGVDEEEAALEEEHDRRRYAATIAALTALRAADPEAAEVVRRRHGLDGVGDGETLEQVIARPLASTGRTLCRETARKACKRGLAFLQAYAAEHVPVGLFSGPPVDLDAESDDDVPAPPARRPHGPFRPRRPAVVHAHVSAPRAPNDDATAHEEPGAWVPAAMVF